MSCPNCFHDFGTGPPGDDLEAACICDCHFEGMFEEEPDELPEDEYP